MDLIVRNYWRANGETQSVVRYSNTNYKNLDDLQETLKKRFSNKNVYWVKCFYDGITVVTSGSIVAQSVRLE